MKTKIFTFLMVAMGLLASTSVFAQNKTTVNLGDSEEYTITVSATLGNWTGTAGTDYSFDWTIDDATAIVGGQATLDAFNGISADVTWIKSGFFNFTVVGTDANGCLTEPLVIPVTVSAMEACVDADNAVNKQMCSLLELETTGEADGDEIISFPVSVSNSSTGKLYTIDYTLSNGATTYTGRETGYTPGDQIEVDINSTQELITLFTATSDDSGSPKEVTVAIKAVTQEGTSLNVSMCATPSYTIEVFEKPSVSFIVG
ncbi:hypothetical protein [Sunxiuqinia sp. sy24]|uniref:hypothetical protein n=1 Tax=Sunxiuqinia sp. sy24 TaxID=3461495 RepID=UPI00404622C6